LRSGGTIDGETCTRMTVRTASPNMQPMNRRSSMSTPVEPEKRTHVGEPEADVTTVREWFERRSFHYVEFADIAHLADQKNRAGVSVTLILPTRNVADTIGTVLSQLAPLTTGPRIVDQVIVVDADSPDGTADIARTYGVEVHSENRLFPDYGP